jgi:Flp pilus assembly pilin Flp
MRRTIRTVRHDKRGITAIEYSLIVSQIILAAVGLFVTLGLKLASIFSAVQ